MVIEGSAYAALSVRVELVVFRSTRSRYYELKQYEGWSLAELALGAYRRELLRTGKGRYGGGHIEERECLYNCSE
jgi:hypothetical protein